jgi:hypothetical protein
LDLRGDAEASSTDFVRAYPEDFDFLLRSYLKFASNLATVFAEFG